MLSRLKYFGKKPLCNLKECRAPKCGNFVFPLCYRCLGVIIGGIFSYYITLNIYVSLLLMVPFFIDTTLQYSHIKESTNIRRFITGILFGVALNIFNIK